MNILKKIIIKHYENPIIIIAYLGLILGLLFIWLIIKDMINLI